MIKYKSGDKVIINPKLTQTEKAKSPGWNSVMDQFTGQLVTISSVYNDEKRFEIKESHIGFTWRFDWILNKMSLKELNKNCQQ